MIWFVNDGGGGELAFQVPPEGLAVGDTIHMVDGRYSGGRYIVRGIQTRPRRWDPTQNQKHLELEPADRPTTIMHGDFFGWQELGGPRSLYPEIAKSPGLKVRYS